MPDVVVKKTGTPKADPGAKDHSNLQDWSIRQREFIESQGQIDYSKSRISGINSV